MEKQAVSARGRAAEEKVGQSAVRPRLRTALLAAAHLFMDMTTIAFLYVLIGVRPFGGPPDGAWHSQAPAALIAACVFGYDLLAFGLQPFFGALVDRKKRAAPLLYASLLGAGLCAAVCALCDFPQGMGVLSAALLVFLSLCNAVFHVAAGAFAIAESENRCAPLGVFVSLGALGVAIGRLYAPAVLFFAGAGLCMFGAAFLLLRPVLQTDDAALRRHFARIEARPAGGAGDLLPLGLLIFAVAVRGFGGGALPVQTAQGEALVLLCAAAAALGKAAGGYVADAFGVGPVALVCLPVSAFLLAFGGTVPALYLVGLALFNTSMPVTLWLSFAALPRLRNTAFGVMACFLMLGSVLAMALSVPRWIPLLLILGSAAALAWAPRLFGAGPRLFLRRGKGV